MNGSIANLSQGGRRARRLGTISVLILLGAVPIATTSGQIAAPTQQGSESVLSFTDRVFTHLIVEISKADVDGAVATIVGNSPLVATALSPIRESFQSTASKFGPVVAWDLSSLVADAGNTRSYRVCYLLYHERAATSLEAQIYRGATGWTINTIAVSSEDVFRKAYSRAQTDR